MLLTRLRWVWVTHVIGLVIVYSKWWAWYGGFTWGPRFLAFASVPAALILALKVERPSERLLENLAVILVLALSAWVGLCSSVFGLYGQGFCTENHYALESFCWYLPEYSVLSRAVVMDYPMPTSQWLLVAVCVSTFVVSVAPLVPVVRGNFARRGVTALIGSEPRASGFDAGRVPPGRQPGRAVYGIPASLSEPVTCRCLGSC